MQYTKSILEEQLKIGEKLPVGWPWRLLIFTAIIFGSTILIYFGMIFGYKPYLNSKLKGFDKEISDLTASVGEEQQKNLANFYSQLVNVQDLLVNHTTASKLFDFLEKNTYQQISFSSLGLSLAEKNLKLEGNASNYKVLIQQLELFRQATEIDSIFLDNLTLGENSIHFSIRLVFKPELII